MAIFLLCIHNGLCVAQISFLCALFCIYLVQFMFPQAVYTVYQSYLLWMVARTLICNIVEGWLVSLLRPRAVLVLRSHFPVRVHVFCLRNSVKLLA